ncbi:MAG: DMP19 family protein [Prevotellaceae bacterium]|nr:DMP19 family protein [Prevotellaceae bacterium]
MKEIFVKDSDLRRAAGEGMDEFVNVFFNAIYDAVGGELTAENMAELNTDQLTLWAYHALQEEVMDGGFVQLIHNGYGDFIFLNPFAKVVKDWGLRDLSKMIYEVKKLYRIHKDEIMRECSDDEFMGLFEKMPEFDDFDDEFVENEERWTAQVAEYIDNNIERFAKVQLSE